jgi:hypothetical protein
MFVRKNTHNWSEEMKRFKIRKVGLVLLAGVLLIGLCFLPGSDLLANSSFPRSSGNDINEVNLIGSEPQPPSPELLEKIAYEGMDEPAGEEMAPIGFLEPFPNPKIHANISLSSSLFGTQYWFAGVECWYQFQGVYASLLTRRSPISLNQDDRISGWIGLTSSDGNTFVQTGWVYLQQGSSGYNGIYAFYQVGSNPARLVALLSADTYYQFRIRYQDPNYWRCEVFMNNQWILLGSAYYPGVTSLYPQAYGESQSADGYHLGMFPISTSWGAQVLAGTQWQYWTHQSLQESIPGVMNLAILNYYYNIQYWGS